ncbi:WD40 domain-containing protein [Xylona heveae TC161]|uniref:WD40 domain-containing protein n=1 Tax=Xylona heveae (strain CBS 132557 / TC161) TaxID=1328760 RepID=A0A165AB79_XYLHT|nr:WD40 domain-containing protein [Xylona heveae TC161]KZF20200.1 WD40 domain-containing protein [Xylona heveae TC161]
MRLDNESSRSSSSSRAQSHGTRFSPQSKSALSNGNPYGLSAANGLSTSQSNGTASGKPRPTYFGHDREEVARILIQSLADLGYNGAAAALTQESGYELESPSVAAFRNAVLSGEWAEAESLLFGNVPIDGGVEFDGADGSYARGLVLAEGADKNEMLFCLRQQKFLELLEERDLGSALMVLRQELTPLNRDISKLHALSSLIMCQSAEDLKEQASWDGAAGASRHILLSELSKSISPSVMIPEHRLAVLLNQVKQHQISNCLYHNTASSPSLYSDHSCDRSQFPLRTTAELQQHTDEVWFLEFSHDGTKLATASKDRTVVVYDTRSWEPIHVLCEHTDPVAYVAWSPDDSKLITCSHDRKARLWDMSTGTCSLTINHHNEPVTTASWAPDGQVFVTGSLDSQLSLCVWDLSGNRLHAWSGYRVQDSAISLDGTKLVTISTEKKIYVYDLEKREELYNLALKAELTCVNISRDSRYLLVNMSDHEIQLIDIETAETVRRYLGQQQGRFVIRSGFGGASENFIISGSEDSRVYIWNRESGTLVETLEGHASGCVNSVSWNPTDPCLFASAGDDKKVRIWSKALIPPSSWGAVRNGHKHRSLDDLVA